MIPSSIRIFVCPHPQDMRRSFDGLALAAKQVLGADPQSGALFCFVNRRGNRIKILWFEPSGYCLLYKRAHGVRFVLPERDGDGPMRLRIDRRQLATLLAGVPKRRR